MAVDTKTLIQIVSTTCFIALLFLVHRFKRTIAQKINVLLTYYPRRLFLFLAVLMVATRIVAHIPHLSGTSSTYVFIEVTGQDIQDGGIRGAYRLLQHQPFEFSWGYGRAPSIVFGSLISGLRQVGLCKPDDMYGCTKLFYVLVISAAILGYIATVNRLIQDTQKQSISLLFVLAFFLGTAGSLGLKTANLDIIFSLLFTIYLLRPAKPWLPTILWSAVFGFMANTKIMLLPFGLVAGILSPVPLVFLLGLAASYAFFSYASSFFGQQGSLLDPFVAAIVSTGKYSIDPYILCLSFNHPIGAIATFFFDCTREGFNKHILRHPVYIATVISAGFAVFVLPLTNLLKTPIQSFKKLVRTWDRQNLLLAVFAYGVAGINLLLLFSIDYRLYYCLPVCLGLLVKTKDKKVTQLVYLSMICLIVKNLWIFLRLFQRGFMPFDPRGMQIFLLLHFYFLLRAASANLLAKR